MTLPDFQAPEGGDERAAFEAWFAGHWSGQYSFFSTEAAVSFAAWQARADLAAQPQAPVALTPEQKRAMWKASDFRGSGGQIDWYVKGIEDAERVHGITQAKEPTNDR